MPTGPGNLQFWEHSPGGAGARAGTRGYGDNRAGSRGAKVFQLSSSQRDGLVPGRHLAISGDILGCHNNGELLAPSGWRPGMLLNLRSAQDSLHHKESIWLKCQYRECEKPCNLRLLKKNLLQSLRLRIWQWPDQGHQSSGHACGSSQIFSRGISLVPALVS